MSFDFLLSKLYRPEWEIPVAFPVLAADEVHIWLAKLANHQELIRLQDYLTEEEKKRCQKYRSEKVRQRFTCSRAVLKYLLGGYLKAAPTKLQIASGEHGKPFLANHSQTPTFHFNLSHSGDLLIYAFTTINVTGIDIEQIHPVKEMDTIITRFFSAQESLSLLNLTPSHREEAFFYTWTRKESLIKANGKGFSIPLNSFSVPAGDNESVIFENRLLDSKENLSWKISSFQPVKGYLAALATATDQPILHRYFRFQSNVPLVSA